MRCYFVTFKATYDSGRQVTGDMPIEAKEKLKLDEIPHIKLVVAQACNKKYDNDFVSPENVVLINIIDMTGGL